MVSTNETNTLETQMKQIQIKEYQKKPVSKAKALTNLKSIYSGFKLFHQKEQHFEIKPKKRKLTRIEQLNLTDEERRLIYDRRSSSYKIRKQRQQSTSSYLTDRKLIRFLLPFSMPLEKKGERSNELYLYNYNNTTKREYMSNEQKYASVVVNTNKLFRDSDIQPDYAERKRPIMHIASQQDRYKNINSTTKIQSSIQTETKKPQQGESRNKSSNVHQLLTDLVTRKAIAYQGEGKSQHYTMLKLERLARSYPQSQKNWQDWCETQPGQEFMTWINLYGQLHDYYFWDPFTFNRENHREQMLRKDSARGFS